jgi:uncharacterized protein YndB with AHSA1/START domain
MTTEKARKRAVRTRMAKTGERYAAARRHIVADDPPASPAAATALPPRVADPGMTDTAIATGSGEGWDHWFRLLDGWGAAERSHTDIARYLRQAHGVDGWWAQAVTVGYERARGLRARHQTSRGFEVSVSKTIPAPRDEVWTAVLEPRRRRRWLEPGDLGSRRRAGPVGRSATFDRPSDGTRVAIAIDARADGRSTVTVTHEGLAGAEDVEGRRVAWRERLERLADLWPRVAAGRRAAAPARGSASSADD